MKTLLVWSLLAVAASAQVTVTDTWTISAPSLLTGEKYSRVSISMNGSNLDHIQIASNKWVVPTQSGNVKFDAILCGEGYCRPVNWETDKQGQIADIMIACSMTWGVIMLIYLGVTYLRRK